MPCPRCAGTIGNHMSNCPVTASDIIAADDGYKKDQGKVQWTLLADMGIALCQVARVLMFGAKKYSRHGWYLQAGATPEKANWTRNVDAAMRHVYGDENQEGWLNGQDVDDESGINHLAHTICDLLFVLTYQLKGLGVDDRRKAA